MNIQMATAHVLLFFAFMSVVSCATNKDTYYDESMNYLEERGEMIRKENSRLKNPEHREIHTVYLRDVRRK